MKLKFLLVLMHILLASGCFAQGNPLAYKLHFHTNNGYTDGAIIAVGAASNGTSAYDGEEAWPGSSSTGVLLAIHRTNGVDGWNHDTGFYSGDIRETLSPGNNITINGIYLWATPGTQNQELHVYPDARPYLDQGVSYSLKLVSVPEGITYTGPTEWGSETTDIGLPFYSTDDGKTGYKFRITITAAQ